MDGDKPWVIRHSLCCQESFGVTVTTPKGQTLSANQTDAMRKLLEDLFASKTSATIPLPTGYTFKKPKATVANFIYETPSVRWSLHVCMVCPEHPALRPLPAATCLLWCPTPPSRRPPASHQNASLCGPPCVQAYKRHWEDRIFRELILPPANPHPFARVLSPLCDVKVDLFNGAGTGVVCPSQYPNAFYTSEGLCCT